MSLNKSIWKLRHWIDNKKIHENLLSFNINAIQLLELKPSIINWTYLSFNQNANYILERNKDKINWDFFII